MPVYKQTLEIMDDVAEQEANRKLEEVPVSTGQNREEPVEQFIQPEEQPGLIPAPQPENQPLYYSSEILQPVNLEVKQQEVQMATAVEPSPAFQEVAAVTLDQKSESQEAVRRETVLEPVQTPPTGFVSGMESQNLETGAPQKRKLGKLRVANLENDESMQEEQSTDALQKPRSQPLDRSKLKVHRSQPGDFWNEE